MEALTGSFESVELSALLGFLARSRVTGALQWVKRFRRRLLKAARRRGRESLAVNYPEVGSQPDSSPSVGAVEDQTGRHSPGRTGLVRRRRTWLPTKRKGLDGDRGAILVEAALVLPLLLMLTLGIWTTARAWNLHNVLDHATREAARFGATTPDPADLLMIALGEVQAARVDWHSVTRCAAIVSGGAVVDGGGDGFSGAQCIASGAGSGQDPTTDDRVQVTLEIPNYQLNFVFFSVTVDLRAQAVARLEP